MSGDERRDRSSTTSATRSRPTARRSGTARSTRPGVAVKVRRDPEDSFAEPEAMVDADGRARHRHACCCPPATSAATARLDPYDFEHIAARWEEIEKLAARWPGRFAALAVDRPDARAWRGVRDARAHARATRGSSAATSTRTASTAASTTPTTTRSTRSCAEPTCRSRCRRARRAGSWRASAAARSASTAPRSTSATPRFVLSHLGWPWVDEAIAMALKFPNVYLGTGVRTRPGTGRRRCCEFLRGPGRAKVLFGTQLPDRRPPPRARPGRASSSLDAGDRAGAARRHRACGVHPPRGRRHGA